MKEILFLLILSVSNCVAQRLADLENDEIDSTDQSVERFNRDNQIYQSNQEFIFDYTILRQKDSVKCQFSLPKYGIPHWKFVPVRNTDSLTIHSIGIVILPYYLNDDQTGIAFQYYNKEKRSIGGLEMTGLIENAKNIWIHPPRSQFFAITEFNSFPFIKTPYQIGRKWKSGLTIGYFSNYERFGLKWDGILNTTETLEIIGKVPIATSLGTLSCFVVQAFAKSNLTETQSTFYFNEQYGFVKIIYELFDKSVLELNLKEIKKATVTNPPFQSLGR